MEAIEHMGSGYTSLANYFCGQLEDLIAEPAQWMWRWCGRWFFSKEACRRHGGDRPWRG